MIDYGLDLAIIGNGRTAALLEPGSRIVWWCFPRFDSDPVFCRLLAGDEEKGFTDVVLEGLADIKSEYRAQHADRRHHADRQQGRRDPDHRFRAAFPESRPHLPAAATDPHHRAGRGLPRITIRFRPAIDYGRPITNVALGSNHIRYWDADTQLRLTTDAPLSYVEREASFVLTRPVHLAFGADEPFPAALGTDLPRLSRAHARLLAGMGAPPEPVL